MKKIWIDVFLISFLGLAAIAVTGALAVASVESVAGGFGFIAAQIMSAATLFLGFLFLPRFAGVKPVVAALFGALFIVTAVFVLHFLLGDFFSDLIR